MRKNVAYIVVTALLLVVCFLITKQSVKEIGEPEDAVKKFAIEQKYQNAEQMVFPAGDRAPDGGGIFVLGQYPNERYQLFYTWVDNEKWNVLNVCEVDFSQDFTTLSGNPSFPNGSQANWGFSSILLKGKTGVQSVVGYTRLSSDQNAKPIPFSFTKVGNFPLWVNKFPENIGGTDYFKAYDRMGQEIWSSAPM